MWNALKTPLIDVVRRQRRCCRLLVASC